MKYISSAYNDYFEMSDGTGMFHNSLNGYIGMTKSEVVKKAFKDGFFVDESLSENIGLEKLVKDRIFLTEEDMIAEKYSGGLKMLRRIKAKSLHLVILSTEQCNFRCKYCYESFERGEMSEEIQDAIVNYVIKNLRHYESLDIDWFGGEPLVGLSVIIRLSEKLIEVAQKLKKPYRGSITTNGYLLSLDVVRKLLKCRITSIQVTLDGLEASHDSARVLKNGNGTYERIVNNLINIRDNIHSHALEIIIRTNVSTDVLNTLPEYIQKMNSYFSSDRRFSFYFRPVGDWGGDSVQTISDKLLPNMSDFYSVIANTNCPLNYNVYNYFINNPVCCAADAGQYIIGSDGTVYKCSMLFDREENNLGCIKSDGEMDISKDKYDKWVMSTLINSSDNCRDCNQGCICYGGTCPAQFFLNTTSSCGYERRSKKYVMQLLQIDCENNPDKSIVRIY